MDFLFNKCLIFCYNWLATFIGTFKEAYIFVLTPLVQIQIQISWFLKAQALYKLFIDSFIFFQKFETLTNATLILFDSFPCGFSKNVSSKEIVKHKFFVTFNIITSHLFPESFIEIPQVVQKISRTYLSILVIFINVHRCFGFFNISLLQTN